ncbi:MAG: 50S ribosomal protein L35 [bacterium]
MPKMKTNSGAAKRFKVTGTGKLVRKKAYLRHQLTCKTSKAKRQLRHSAVVDKANAPAIRKLLPYL